MMNTIAGWLGYVLNFIYNIVQNYGLAIILFSVLIRLVLLPITISQQNSTRKSARVQDEANKLRVKYANDPEQLNKATMELYKREHFNPLGGCLVTIVQFILFISIFYLVSRPLTYMKKVDSSKIEDYASQITAEQKSNYQEIKIIDLFGKDDQDVYINMDFLGLDLSKVPTQNLNDPKIFIIPILYVLFTFLNIHMVTKMTTTPEMKKKQEEREAKLAEEKRKKKEEREKKKEFEKELKKAKKEDKALIKEEVESQEEEPESMEDMQAEMGQMTKSMNYMMPILSISIALIAPLGLCLYWLVSILLQSSERLIINFFSKLIYKKKEAESNG